MFRLLLLLFFIGHSLIGRCQLLYMPRDVKAAFEKDTRSKDGNPGRRYWQNTARYAITVDVKPPARTVAGVESITYFNNSPDSLNKLYFKLIQNIHRIGAARFEDTDSAYITPGVQIDSFAVAGEARPWQYTHASHTIQDVALATPLAPHDSIVLFFKWHYEISRRSDREGMIDTTTFLLAYYYPRIAVYDDYNGWDKLEFNDQQEFYNDFNDYTCQVRVPANYIVWSTGTLLNAAEVLSHLYVQRLERALQTDSIITIVDKKDIDAGNVTRQQAVNTWRWQAAGVSDVTILVSNHFVWDATSTVVDSNTHRRTVIHTVYNDSTQQYRQAADFARYSVNWLSHHWPGIPYPYAAMTLFQGFSAMEYPMMANVLVTPSPAITRFLIDHEIAHTYFPFYMGINETRYPFMDEGWAVFAEVMIGRSQKTEQEANELYKGWWVYSWVSEPGAEGNLPLITPGNVLKSPAYGHNAYTKSSAAYLALKDLLGDDLFKVCLHGFMNRWHGKHPLPWDFFNSFNDIAHKNLDWFWNNWFFSNDYIDVSIHTVRKDGKGYVVSVENNGGLMIPLDLVLTYRDGSSTRIHQTPAIWKTNPQRAAITIAGNKTIQSIILDTGVFMDANDKNNNWNSSF